MVDREMDAEMKEALARIYRIGCSQVAPQIASLTLVPKSNALKRLFTNVTPVANYGDRTSEIIK